MKLLKLTACMLFLMFFMHAVTVNACTNFCLDTPQGPIWGCNLDYFITGDGLVFINQRNIAKKGLGPSTTGKVAEWISKYGSVTFNIAGKEMAFGGMNEAGLVVSGMELLPARFPDPDETPPLTIGMWAQYILDTCGNIDEVIEASKNVRIEDAAPPVHFLIGDAKGECVAVEWYEGRIYCRKGEDLPVKAMSNSFYSVALDIYKKGGPKWWQSDRGDTNKRFTQAAERNKNYDSSKEPNAIKYAFETLTQVVDAPHTKWNIVYDIPKRQVFFRSAASPTLKYLTLTQFDLSCDAPLLMMDINAQVKDDVKKYFKPYDPDVNTAVFRNLCQGLELNLSENIITDVMNVLNGFKCATVNEE